jgi:hypothetical protein
LTLIPKYICQQLNSKNDHAGKFHFLLIFKLKLEVGIISKIDEFATLKHAVWEYLVITSSNHKTSWILDSTLDHLEIMWEVAYEINLFVDLRLGANVELSDCFGVLLEDI